MEITINERPSMPPAAPAQSTVTAKPATTELAGWVRLAEAEPTRRVRPAAAELAVRVRPAAAARQLARVHQVQIQAGPARVLVPTAGYDVAGFAGADALTSTKRIVVRGVPPRGKPV